MNLKTYRAKTMPEALVAVKKDLGRDAVILHTRTYRVGAVLGLGGRSMVEVTASDDARAAAPLTGRQTIAAAANPTGTSEPAPRSAMVARAYGPATVSTAAAASDQTSPRTAQVAPPPVAAPQDPGGSGIQQVVRTAISSQPFQFSTDAIGDSLVKELAAIRRMVGQVLQSAPRAIGVTGSATEAGGGPSLTIPAAPMPDALLKHYMKLIENEVARELADEIVGAIRDELNPGELTDDGIVRQAVLRRLESLLPVAEAAPAPASTRKIDGRPLTIALVGPTGVGKTTTIAKLAATYRLRHGKRVGLITSDTYRIAAVDQLRTYANIIGVPLKVVLSPEEMRSACEALNDMDVVLIDTAGRSPGDAMRLEELRQFVRAASPHQTHLVLSSVLSESSLLRTAERFAELQPSRLIFTKLDEAASFGVLVNVARRINTRLSFVTTGQEVPDDIEPGRADRLARLVLDGSAAG